MNEPKLPWYKQPLVWMLIAIPASAVIAGSYTIYLAVVTADGLVVDDYYKQGLAINRQIERDAQAERLQLAADVDIDPVSGYVKVRLDPGVLDESPTQIELALRHATQERQDNLIVLYKGLDNMYVGSVGKDIRKGIWYVELTGGDDGAASGWKLSQRVRIDELTRLRIEPIPVLQPEG